MGLYLSDKEKIEKVEEEFYKLFPILARVEELVIKNGNVNLEDEYYKLHRQIDNVEVSLTIKPANIEQHRLSSIEKASKELMDYVVSKYDVKCYDDFTCPHHRKLAETLDLFPKQ